MRSNSMYNHFIDSNVFLSVVKHDSIEHSCVEYFKTNSFKCTSETVHKESKKVISKFKSLHQGILDEIDEYVSNNNISDDKIIMTLNKIKINFLNKYCHQDCPFGFKPKKFKRIVNRIFLNYYNVFKYYLHNSFVLWVDEEFNNLDIMFKRYLNDLENQFQTVKVFDVEINTNDVSILHHLAENGIHKPDNRILLEAFKLSMDLDADLDFITIDNGIFKSYDYIVELFKHKITPKKPGDFVNN